MIAYRLLATIFIFASCQLQANPDYRGPAELRCIDKNNRPISPIQQQIQRLNDNLAKQASTYHAQQTYRATQVNYANLNYCPALASFYNYHQQDLYSVAYNLWNDTPPASYFADKFEYLPSLEVFHQFYHYQDPGFCKYVQAKPGWDEFLENIGPVLSENNQLTQSLRSKCPKSLGVLQWLSRTQQQRREAENRTAIKQSQIQQLKQLNFNDNGIALLDHYGVSDQFLYAGNIQQCSQLKQISKFINDVGEFGHNYHQTPELSEITENATGFGILANNANRENLPNTSQAFLEIGQNLLALGRGLVAGCGRNVSGIYHMVRHPINTFVDIGTLAANIGIGIGNVASLVPRLGMGLMLDDQAIIQSVQQDVNYYCDGAKQIYQYIGRTWQDKTTAERYELAGSLMVDLLLMKGLPAASSKLATIKNLSRYKPQAFSKLGNVGREINETIGLTCAKSRDYLRKGRPAIMAGEAELLASEGFGFAREVEVGLNVLKNDYQLSKAGPKVENLAKISTQLEEIIIAGVEETKWGFWADFKNKITINGREYAKINDRLYTRHAIDRMAPKRYGKSFITRLEGRDVPISIVEDVISRGHVTKVELKEGIERITRTIDKVSVVLENDIVITVLIKT